MRAMSFTNLKLSLHCSASHKKLLDDGKQKAKSALSKQKADTEDTSSINKSIRNVGTLYMQESHLGNKPMILNVKYKTLNNDFPIMKSLQTSDLDSISSVKDCKPYWKCCSKEISDKLWLPIKTDYVDLDSICSTSCSKKMDPFCQCLKEMVSKNLFLNSQMTSYQSLQCSQPDTTEQENITYTRKIRIYPTTEQVVLFNKCIGANRFFYNKANAFIKESYSQALETRLEELQSLTHCGHCSKSRKTQKLVYCRKNKLENSHFCEKHKDTKLGVDMKYFKREVIRDAIITPDDQLDEENIWQKDVPYDTRQFAIDQCMAAYKSCFALKQNGHIQSFDVSFKTKKGVNHIFQINKNAIDFETLQVCKRRTKTSFRVRKRDLELIREGTDCNVTILKTKPNKWYMCLPRVKEPPIYEQAAYKSAFLDPGVRSFATFYSPDGVCGKLGDQFADKFILPLMEKIDKFESLRAKSESIRTRNNIRRRLYKLRDKAKNRINDLHWKTCNYLCRSFDTIFLPEFNVSDMVEKTSKRVISKKTVRKLLNLSHCQFRERLQSYAKTKHRNVVLMSEAYTTKTCGVCGKTQNVGGDTVFKCDCGYNMDRDFHGARNLVIRCLS